MSTVVQLPRLEPHPWIPYHSPKGHVCPTSCHLQLCCWGNLSPYRIKCGFVSISNNNALDVSSCYLTPKKRLCNCQIKRDCYMFGECVVSIRIWSTLSSFAQEEKEAGPSLPPWTLGLNIRPPGWGHSQK